MRRAFRLVLTAALVLPPSLAAVRASAARQAAAQAPAADADLGRQLFAGTIRFANGGPACAECHDSAGLARPGGGTMGPDLTTIDARIGPEGVRTSLRTLFFPTMMPLFQAHPLTPPEQAALQAFFASTSHQAPRAVAGTVWLGIGAIVVFVILMIVTGLAGRRRIRSVRLALLARAASGRVSS
ncbi:MAG TPA: hypothetical protein VFX12_03010 [Vicinamibacterales bacterium]|nr:hypothetical protein [Vicinamibacterales bacterium]